MYLDIEMSRKVDFVLIGLGAVGRALVPALVKAGYVCNGLIGRGRAEERALAKRCRAPLATDLSSLSDDFDLLFLCVRDSQLDSLARDLAEQEVGWNGRIVSHTAGALSSEVLAPLREKGAEVASFHPFGSFARTGRSVQFKGMTFGIEGTPKAQEIARKIARELGGRPLIVPAEKRAHYHLAAVFASNFFVGDLALAVEMLSQIGLDERQALQVISPIVEGTFRNVKKLGVRNALTGPAARGDVETLARHEAALDQIDPALVELYRRFCEYLERISKEDGLGRSENA
jgi:predicted short-subunit dehydrogenase-like oxidoreductase (DUF2520 family)